MKLQPIRSYRPPAYPTQEKILQKPQLLYIVPKRWRHKSGVMTALILTVATGLTGCGSQTQASSPQPDTSPSAPAASTPSPISEYVTIGEVPDASVPLAAPEGSGPQLGTIPIFTHGDGRGSYGCVSVAPPVFLSEEEAIQVIREEAEAQGVYFNETTNIEGTFPSTDLSGMATATGTWDGTLALDGYDKALNLGFEFVSKDDVVAWKAEDGVASTVSSYDAQGAALELSSATENVAVFYDPMSADHREFNFDWDDPEGSYELYTAQYTAEQKEKVIEDLRAQVRDFLEWLAGQGVI